MNLDNERKAFEEWYKKHHNGRQISYDYVYEDNSYSIGYANAMWIRWQASASRQGYKLVPIEPSKETLKLMLDAYEEHLSEGMSDAYKAMIGEETK